MMMAEQVQIGFMTEEEYLQAEEKSTIRHEYVDGCVFAMSDSADAHNVISGNLFSLLRSHLRGTQCRAYHVAMKVRIESANSYYYPDIMVTGEPFAAESVSKQSPVLLIEVLSPSTASVDTREKLVAYRKISSLRQYVIVHQTQQLVEVYSRNSDMKWEMTTLSGDSTLVLESIPNGPLNVRLSVIYDGYNPPHRVKEEEEEEAYEYADFSDVPY
jgi:Uma2 family endonuclease